METLGGSKASPDQREYSAGVGGGVAGRGLNMFGLLWQSTSDWAAKTTEVDFSWFWRLGSPKPGAVSSAPCQGPLPALQTAVFILYPPCA